MPFFMDRQHKVGITREEIRIDHQKDREIKGFDDPIPVYRIVPDGA